MKIVKDYWEDDSRFDSVGRHSNLYDYEHGGMIDIVDRSTSQVIKQVETPGPPDFLETNQESCQISSSPSEYGLASITIIFMIMALIAGVIFYLVQNKIFRKRFQQHGSDRELVPNSGPHVSNEKEAVTESTKSATRSKRSLASTDQPPALVDETQVVKKPRNEQLTGLGDGQFHLAETLALNFTPVKSSEEAAEDLKRNFEILKSNCKLMGADADDNMILTIAANFEDREYHRQSQMMSEIRSFAFYHHHKSVDREMKNRHHEESMHAKREHHNWLAQLISSRERAMKSITKSFFICLVICIFALAYNQLAPVFQKYWNFRLHDYLPSIHEITRWNYLYSMLTSLVNVDYREATASLADIPTLLMRFLIPCFLEIVVRGLGFPEDWQKAVRSFEIILLFTTQGWVPTNTIIFLTSSFALAYWLARCYIWRKFFVYKKSLENKGNPSTKDVNEFIGWFDLSCTYVQVAIILVGVVWTACLFKLGRL